MGTEKVYKDTVEQRRKRKVRNTTLEAILLKQIYLINTVVGNRYFANLTAMVAEEHNRKTHYEKLHLFEQLKEVKGGIKVLEIGAGSGHFFEKELFSKF